MFSFWTNPSDNMLNISQKMGKSLNENKYFKKKICMSVIETDLPVSLGVASMEGWILKVIDNLS